MSGHSGILLVDKPQGWTSHDVVARVRRLFGLRRVGHTGTLDPMATGLLVVCLGQATRVVEYMVGHSKKYTGTIALGTTTDTDDAEGTVLAERDVPADVAGRLGELEARFSGPLDQMPPAYSAIKIAGRKAYDIARKGGQPELVTRAVRIDRLELTFHPPATLKIVVSCSAGTYVRSLARDIGAAVGCGGHLSALRRTRVGHFDVADAYTLDDLAEAAAAGAPALADLLLPVDEGLTSLSAAIVTRATATSLSHGLRHSVGAGPVAPVRVYEEGGSLVGIGAISTESTLHCAKVLWSS